MISFARAMSDLPTTSDPMAPTAEPNVPELSATELRLERERCALELERLALELERLRLERERDLYGNGSNALHVGMGVLALAVVVVLALGLLFGYNAGIESGRLQAPAPRKVVVNGAFLDLLRQTPSGTMAFAAAEPSGDGGARRLPWVTLYSRPASSAAFGNLPLIR